MVFEYKDEVITQSVGFVEYSINEESAFCVNGVPVKLKGVNHHDTDLYKVFLLTPVDFHSIQPDSKLELSLLAGNLWIKPLPRNELITALKPMKGYLQTAGLICPHSKRGCSRVSTSIPAKASKPMPSVRPSKMKCSG